MVKLKNKIEEVIDLTPLTLKSYKVSSVNLKENEKYYKL